MRAGWWPIRSGRALAIAGVGAPIALSLGVPLGTLLGDARLAQRVRRDLAADTGGHGLDPGEGARFRGTAGRQTAGRRPCCAARPAPGAGRAGAVVLAHSILYTYVAPLLGPAGLSGQTDRVLLTFGLASLAGVWISGLLIDRGCAR